MEHFMAGKIVQSECQSCCGQKTSSEIIDRYTGFKNVVRYVNSNAYKH